MVSLIHVIEHLSDPIKCLKKLIRKLKTNGYLIIETPNFDSAMARIYNTKFRLLHDKTLHFFILIKSLIRLVRDCGLRIVRIEYPFFEGPFFNKINLLGLLNKNNKYSPPFYGSTVLIFAKKIKKIKR